MSGHHTGVATALVLALRLASTLGELVAIGVTELAWRLFVRPERDAAYEKARM